MTDRHTASSITDDALTALYERLEAAEQTESQRQLATAREALASATVRAARADAAIARVRAVVHIAADEDVTDWQRGFRACSVVVLGALDTARPEPTPSQRPELRNQIAKTARTVPLHLGPNATAMAQRGEPIILNMSEADDLADAVLALLYREWPWLRAAAEDAETEPRVDRQTAVVLAALHRSAEGNVSRVIDLYERWVAAGPPPLGTSISRWWDARLVELHAALDPPKEQ